MSRKPYEKYDPKFKISCIIDMRTNHLGFRETIRKYFNTKSKTEENSFTCTLKRWERIFLEEGTAGFYKDRRGRPNMKPKKKRLPKNVKQDLITENQNLKEQLEYLRAENEYLKKLDALVRAEEQKKSKKR